MIYYEGGIVLSNRLNAGDFVSVVNGQLNFPLTVRPTGVVTTSATNPACVIDNPTANNSNISFRNNSNIKTTGMRTGNSVIAQNQITTNESGGNIQNDVAIQINQNGLLNVPHDMNLWGDIYSKSNIGNDGTATFRNDIEIRPTVPNRQAALIMRGGATTGSDLDLLWYVGRGAFNVGANNFAIVSNRLPRINNGVTRKTM